MPKFDNPVADLYYQRHHWDFRLGTYLALLRTMAIRPMVERLYQGALTTQTFTRLKRTREIIATLVVAGLDSALGREALARIARAHEHVSASGDEYRYVLSVFFLEPLRFNALYGVRRFSAADVGMLFEFWMQVGERMGVPELLPDLAAWEHFHAEFERAHLGASEQGRALAHASLHEVVRLVIPRGLQELTRQALLGTMDPGVRAALGLRAARLPTAVSLGSLRAISVFGAGRRVPILRADAAS